MVHTSKECLEKKLECRFWNLTGHMDLPLASWMTQDKSLTQQFWQFPHLYYGDINSCKKGYWSGYLVKLIPHYYFSPWLTVSKWLLLTVWIRAPRRVTVKKSRMSLPEIVPPSFQNLVSMHALRNNDGVLPGLISKEVFMPIVKAHEKGRIPVCINSDTSKRRQCALNSNALSR